jgi:hypothetical protein
LVQKLGLVSYSAAAKDLGFYLLAAPQAPDSEQVKVMQRELHAKAKAAMN